jgi:hypothetical protein
MPLPRDSGSLAVARPWGFKSLLPHQLLSSRFQIVRNFSCCEYRCGLLADFLNRLRQVFWGQGCISVDHFDALPSSKILKGLVADSSHREP